MSYYEQNIIMLKKRFPYIVEEIEERNETDENHFPVYCDEDIDGNKIFAIEKDDYLWYLNSRYHSKVMVDEWCAKHKCKHYFEVLVVFGLGNGEYLLQLREENPENVIIVFEPSIDIFLKLIEQRDMTAVFESDKLFLVLGKNEVPKASAWIKSVISYSNCEYTDFCALPGYVSIFNYEYLLYKRAYMESIEELVLTRNTLALHGKNMVENTFSHIRDFTRQSTLANLVLKFQEKKEEMPDTAFLISAGPSLDKNIEDLKLIQGRAFVMAVDTAMKPLLQKGIVPDMFCTLDAVKDIFLFEQEGIADVPVIMNINVRKGVSEIHTGKHFYILENADFGSNYLDKYGKVKMLMGDGGSVATDAFLALEYMGFKTIVLVGQDLAYPGNRSHAKAAYDDIVNPETQRGNFFTVEDINGEEVLTRQDMNSYRRWFENEIVNRKEIHVIDATEGGAKIRGTEILTLKEAIERQCQKQYNFRELIESVEPTFTKEEQEEIEKDLDTFDEQIEEVAKRLKDGKRMYERLDKLNRQRKYQTREFRRTYEQIAEFNEWLNGDIIVELLSDLAHLEEFQLQYEAYKVKEDTFEEIRDIVKQGIGMIDAYLGKIDFLAECAKNMEE